MSRPSVAWCALAGVVLALSFPRGSFGQSTVQPWEARKLGPSQWQQDLDVMVSELERRHIDLYHTIGRVEFHQAARTLRRRIPDLTQDQVILELMRLVSRIGDGHTQIDRLRAGGLSDRRFPIRFYLAADGLLIQEADSAHATLLGALVLRVGDRSVQEALDAVGPLVQHDAGNPMYVKAWAPAMLTSPSVLAGLGVISDPEVLRLVLKQDGDTGSVALAPVGPGKRVDETGKSLFVTLSSRAEAPVTVSLQTPGQRFLLSVVPGERLTYVRINEILDTETETLEGFISRAVAVADTSPVDKLVLDLRLNTGGNYDLLGRSVSTIIRSRHNRPGGLFVIIGRRTNSAAQLLVNDLEHFSEALFVGEPTAESPNFYGDYTTIELPNSGLVVGASTIRWQRADPRDTRVWTAPDLAADPTISDLRTNRDPALEVIRSFSPRWRSVSDQVLAALRRGGPEAAREAYRVALEAPVNAYAVFPEMEVDAAGYELVGRGQLDSALAVFRLNTELAPQSWRAWDSFGETLAALGQRDAAIAAYERSVKLNVRSLGGHDALRRLRTRH